MKTACVLDRERSNKETIAVIVNAKTHAKYQRSGNQQLPAELQTRCLRSPDTTLGRALEPSELLAAL